MKCAFAGLALACLAFQAAQAAPRPGTTRQLLSENVNYADLDLTREQDAQVLMVRIKDAAYRVCGGDPRRHVAYDLMPARVEFAFKECREGAVARAVATIDMPQVTASSR
ncbi:UrcA family protein [Peristeroidobacter soli]|uniref:UrcA family protein n=1 Tax=Peristeroidobacter soli TaxID=2497877 RepID=UPI00101D0207